MPGTKEIRVYQISGTQSNPDELQKWLASLGVSQSNIDQMFFNDCLNGAERVVGAAARRCYMSFEPGLNPNVNKIRSGWTDYFNNVLKSGHGSVLEHATYTYAIEGVTRVFTGEMNRHRAGVAISEGSMRYISFENIPYWVPLSIRGEVDDFSSKEEKLKFVTREIFQRVFEYVEGEYKHLCKLWDLENQPFAKKKKLTSMFRRIIPMGVSTGGVWTLNLRALRHVIALRTTEHAEEEIALVCSLIAKDICEKEPRLFGDFKQDETTGAWVPEYPKV